MSRKLEHVFTLQQGDSGTLRVADQTAWHVVREVWQGRQLLDTRVVSRHHARAEAEAARQQAETDMSSQRKGEMKPSDSGRGR